MTLVEQTARIHELEHQLAEYRRATAQAETIHRAIGMLMVCHGIDESRATTLLYTWSADYDIDPWVLAATLVHLGASGAGAAHGAAVPHQRRG